MLNYFRLLVLKSAKQMTLPKIALFLVSIGVAFSIGEVIVRQTEVDWKYTEKTLYYQHADLNVHQPIFDPDLLFGLKPGKHNFEGKYSVSVNSFGFRGREVEIAKPEGVYRIIVVGGSNAYGATLNDNQTWPAQLEKALNEKRQRPFEVWNLGVSAYVGRQMIANADKALAQYDPDLIIIALSNAGMRAFLKGTDLKPYFEKWPQLWFDLVIAPRFDILPDFINHFLLRNLRVYRYSLISVTGILGMRSLHLGHHEQQNIRAVRRFIQDHGKEVDIGLFICPAFDSKKFEDYYKGLDMKMFNPKGAHLPLEYHMLHPPAPVMVWYSEILTEWLQRDFKIPVALPD